MGVSLPTCLPSSPSLAHLDAQLADSSLACPLRASCRATPGPEDPRAVWSPEGVPVMIIGMDTVRPEACRTMGVMDLRVLWPALRDELERIAWPSVEESGKSAKELDHGTEVWFDGQGQREKKCVRSCVLLAARF